MDGSELNRRLRDPTPSVRRVAVLDLVRLSERGEPGAAAMLCEHLGRESDEKSLILMARHLGAHGDRAAMGALAALRDNPATPAAPAHAAILAHDRLERALLSG